jgi:hypothetical protein
MAKIVYLLRHCFALALIHGFATMMEKLPVLAYDPSLNSAPFAKPMVKASGTLWKPAMSQKRND